MTNAIPQDPEQSYDIPDNRVEMLQLLESLLPYLEYASAKGLPNAQHKLEVIRNLLWRS